jgi:hypothetical protein
MNMPLDAPRVPDRNSKAGFPVSGGLGQDCRQVFTMLNVSGERWNMFQ